MTSACIWVAQVMVGHYSGVTYLHHIRSINQEQTLAVKASFECWDVTFVVKIHAYNTDNGIFAEQNFRTSIVESKQTNNTCGVVSYN